MQSSTLLKNVDSLLHTTWLSSDSSQMTDRRAANCYDFGVAATLFNPDYAATLVTNML